MDLRELYQDIILDHGRHPRNFHTLENANHFAHGHNPLCGDKITIYLRIEDARIAAVSFEGKGCAISMASASLMTEILIGKTEAEADLLFKSFHAAVTGGIAPAVPEMLEEDQDRLRPLTGVKAYPARVKCATLAWHTLSAAVSSGTLGKSIKTE